MECRDLGEVKEFLHMRITRNGKDICLDQRDYLDKVLECAHTSPIKLGPTAK